MAAQPAERRARRTPLRALADERRGWLSHGLAALAISGLGLAVAASVSLTSSAEPAPLAAPASTTLSRPAAPLPTSTPESVPAAADPSLAAFSRPQRAEDASRSVELRAAVVKERAAQRAEDLAKNAEVMTQAARDAGGAARSKDLATSERATREAAVKIAQQRLAAAIRKRVAAEVERQGVETLASTSSTTPGDAAGTEVGSTAIPSGGGSASPVPGAVIGASFGQYGSWSRYHTGLDFRAGFGTEIKAVQSGVVVYAGNKGDWAGNHVAIRHAGGLTSMSSHMSSMAVRAGQTVQAGQTIGYVGSTGRSFGAHLHFELYPVGVRHGDVYKAVNPVPWLQGIGVNVR